MANPLHLALLSEGTETWNSWVHTHLSAVTDFSETQLEYLTFDRAHLIGATFVGANLSQATLQGVGLSRAIPYHVVHIKANFSDACLTGADLREAFLRGTLYSLNDMLEILLHT